MPETRSEPPIHGDMSGQVTSIVRYEKGSRFHAHDHPEGEEILVLEGVFSDEHGDWPAGTYLLNPEGFRHAPFSREGCDLFVKLRQYAGEGRHHVALRTDGLPWRSGPHAGIEIKQLYAHADFPDAMRLERWAPGAYGELSWLRLPARTGHALVSTAGCELYVKTGALPALREARAP